MNQKLTEKSDESFWSDIFKSEGGEKLQVFLAAFIEQFINELHRYSVVSEDIEEPNATQFATLTDFIVDNVIELTSSDDLANIGVQATLLPARLVKVLTLLVAECYNRKTTDRILNILLLQPEKFELVISMLACDVCKMYEEAITYTLDVSNIILFAKVAVDRIFTYKESRFWAIDKYDNFLSEISAENLAQILVMRVLLGQSKTNCQISINIDREGMTTRTITFDDIFRNNGVKMYINNHVRLYNIQRNDIVDCIGFRALSTLNINDRITSNHVEIQEDHLFADQLTSLESVQSVKKYADKLFTDLFCQKHDMEVIIQNLKKFLHRNPTQKEFSKQMDSVLDQLSSLESHLIYFMHVHKEFITHGQQFNYIPADAVNDPL